MGKLLTDRSTEDRGAMSAAEAGEPGLRGDVLHSSPAAATAAAAEDV